jgi:uncharacterized membrane protein
VFDEITGLPVHALVVHGAVVFLPLLALGSIVYAVAPKLRPRIGWAVVLLAIAAPIGAFVARQSGEALERRLTAAGYGPEILDQVNTHQSYGNLTFWFTLALGVATLVLAALASDDPRMPEAPAWLTTVTSVVVIALAVVVGIYVFLTGDSGARAVWEGVV